MDDFAHVSAAIIRRKRRTRNRQFTSRDMAGRVLASAARSLSAIPCIAPRRSAIFGRSFSPAALAGVAPISRRHMSLKDLDAATVAKIQATWKIVEKDLDSHAVKFYTTMLEMGPSIRQLFTNRNEFGFTEEDAAPGLKRHSIDVMVMIGHAVAGLNDLKSIEHELKELAARHAKYGVEQAHFPIMGKALLLTLEKELGSKWTPEVKNAWISAYEACREIMEPAMMQEHKRLSDFKSTEYMRPEKPHVD